MCREKAVKRCIYKSKAESFNHEESTYVICIYYGFLGLINQEELTPWDKQSQTKCKTIWTFTCTTVQGLKKL